MGGLGSRGAVADIAIRSGTLPVTDSVCGVGGTFFGRAELSRPAPAPAPPPGVGPASGIPIGIIPAAPGVPCTGSGSPPVGIVGGVGACPVDGRTGGTPAVGPPAARSLARGYLSSAWSGESTAITVRYGTGHYKG